MGKLVLNAGPDAVAAEIDRFSDEYHEGFLKVRGKSIQYIFGEMADHEINDFSEEITAVLKEWGACRRGAPCTVDCDEMTGALCSTELRQMLRQYVDNGWVIYVQGSDDEILKNNAQMLSLLTRFQNEFLIANTNITYPTKLLLLLTGLSVGIDSQVREGLAKCGVEGFKSTRYLLPTNVLDKGAAKLFSLHVLLAKCWYDNAVVLQEGVRRSKHRYLLSYLNAPARVMDILLFNGGGLFSYENCNRRV